ncbi:hypothetical protein R6Q57_005756 [Mikania cordata]
MARHHLHRTTEFFYGKNQKVKPKAILVTRPMRTDQSSKPRAKPQKVGFPRQLLFRCIEALFL